MPFGSKALSEAQPAGRAPAPGKLGLVQAFINSNYDLRDDHGAELFGSPDGLREWLERRELADGKSDVTTTELERAIVVREGYARCS